MMNEASLRESNIQDNNLQETQAAASDKLPEQKVKRRHCLKPAACILLGLVLGIVLTAGFLRWGGENRLSGFLLPRSAASSEPGTSSITISEDEETQQEWAKLCQIYSLLRNNYYRDLSDAEMIRAMYDGMCEKMDSPYTFYLSSEDNAAVEEAMQGSYSGIGAQVSYQDGNYTISDIFDASPAAEGGLRIGDLILEVEGEAVSLFKDVSQLAAAVRGEDGSELEILVYRPSENKEYRLTLTRRKIQNANLHSEMLEDDIAYIRIAEFNSGVSLNFRQAVEDLLNRGAKTFIFDLRNNGGGYVHEVVAMLDYLLPREVIATARGRMDGKPFEENWDSIHEASVPEELRYTILINRFSASASELFSGCLRDYGKAVLVGEKSFGKGVGSITENFTDGSALQITNFHYYLPGGDNLQDNGLLPQIPVELPEEKMGVPISQLSPEEDTQLQAAIREAKKQAGTDEKTGESDSAGR